jgi:hypothetical protein
MDAYSLGQYLREARETRELSLQQAEADLKIRRFILEAFEAGDFGALDVSPVQIRGFLRNYARFLGLDEDTVIQYYDSSQQPDTRRRGRRPQATQEPTRPAGPQRSAEPPARPMPAPAARQPGDSQSMPVYPGGRREVKRVRRRRRFNLLLVLVIAAAAISIIAFVATRLIEPPAGRTGTPVPAATQPGVAALPTLTPTLPASAVPALSPTPVLELQQSYAGEPVLVTIGFTQRTWVRVEADGEEIFAGIVRPDELVIEQRANGEIYVQASNAQALGVVYNGQTQPVFGARGQSVSISFRPGNDIRVEGGSVVLAATATPEPRLTEVDLGGQPVAATETPEGADAITATPTPTATDATVTEETPLPTSTPDPSLPTQLPVLGGGQVSAPPTPLPPTPSPTVQVVDSVPTATAGGQPPTAEASPEPTNTAAPSLPTAVLPPRQTPSNVTPTKPPS